MREGGGREGGMDERDGWMRRRVDEREGQMRGRSGREGGVGERRLQSSHILQSCKITPHQNLQTYYHKHPTF